MLFIFYKLTFWHNEYFIFFNPGGPLCDISCISNGASLTGYYSRNILGFLKGNYIVFDKL